MSNSRQSPLLRCGTCAFLLNGILSFNSCCLKILDHHPSMCLQHLQVRAEWILRPSEDKALRTAEIGASGVSEVLTDSRRCRSHATALEIQPIALTSSECCLHVAAVSMHKHTLHLCRLAARTSMQRRSQMRPLALPKSTPPLMHPSPPWKGRSRWRCSTQCTGTAACRWTGVSTPARPCQRHCLPGCTRERLNHDPLHFHMCGNVCRPSCSFTVCPWCSTQ